MKLTYLPKWFRSIIKYIDNNDENIFTLPVFIGTPFALIETAVHKNAFPMLMLIAGSLIVSVILFLLVIIFIDRVLYEDQLKQNISDGTTVIPFSLFEGAYVRNPETWTLAEDHVERVSDEYYQEKGYWFTWPDYKRYVKFCRRIEEQKEEHEEQQELSLVHSEIKRFEADPVLYIKNGKELLKLEYAKPQKEYDQLQERIAEKRRQLAMEEISNDYLKE